MPPFPSPSPLGAWGSDASSSFALPARKTLPTAINLHVRPWRNWKFFERLLLSSRGRAFETDPPKRLPRFGLIQFDARTLGCVNLNCPVSNFTRRVPVFIIITIVPQHSMLAAITVEGFRSKSQGNLNRSARRTKLYIIFLV